MTAEHTSTTGDPLAAAVGHAAHLLPAQGPISVFVHHNTLHAFEHLPFHRAIVEASRVYDTQPYLSEERFREFYSVGRITDADLDRELEARWQSSPPTNTAGIDGRLLERLALLHDLEAPSATVIRWHIENGDALKLCRRDIPDEARRRLLGKEAEEQALTRLWHECLRIELPVPSSVTPASPLRTHRDMLFELTGTDSNEWVHPILARYAAGFLDDGTAAWPMPHREQGFFAAWVHLVSTDAAPLPGWLRGLRDQVRNGRYAARGPEAIVREALEDLGVPAESWPDYITRLLLHLRGWAGMFHWFETHPNERLSAERHIRLIDFLAVRIIYDRRAWMHIAQQQLGGTVDFRRLKQHVENQGLDRPEAHPDPIVAQWRLFQLAQVVGIDTSNLARLTAADRVELLGSIDRFSAIERRQLWQEAYEAHYRSSVLGALAANLSRPIEERQPAAPPFQVVCCIDEREESFRRHIEEVDPSVETFGTAGFFGLAIEYTGIDDGRGVPLCPIVVEPHQSVREVAIDEDSASAERRAKLRRGIHRARFGGRHASQSLLRGIFATPILGAASAIALPGSIFAPRLTARLREAVEDAVLPAPVTRLATTSRPNDQGVSASLPLSEQVDRIAATLENIGMTKRFARIICFLGHGSVSMNNPHKSSYDCGACGGRDGAANARLFADLANHSEVRERLRERGIDIPASTVFIGGLHNTASDAIDFADLDQLPTTHADDLARLRAILDEARARSAQERCRRFESAPEAVTPKAALVHVEARTASLDQPRPELGHCTNAACIVGRRSLSRGVFLDRRSFLVSYDPEIDPSGAILERTLAAVGPVGSGINLEYFFSFVDNTIYGCGSKLAHNIVSMVGVMDGPWSDLRTGLPKQMIEIHEPMRLLLVVESELAQIEAVAARQPAVRQLVVNQWVQLIALVPSTGEFRRWTPDGWKLEQASDATPPTVNVSVDWFRGHHDFLGPALIRSTNGGAHVH